MEKVIIIKYGELNTKKDNINYFIKALRNDLSKKIDNDIEYDHGRMIIFGDDLDTVKDALNKTFGIHEYEIGYKLETNNIDIISLELVKLVKERDFNTFKVSTKRSDKSYEINSMEISKHLGGVILRNISVKKVDVSTPELLINVEIRKDSSLIYFDSPPHTSKEALNKVLTLAEKLSDYSNYIKVHIIHFTDIQEAIYKNCPKEYMITIMRRCMYRIAEMIAHRENCKCIVNGESIGQVASQTLTSMNAINEVVKMPVIRPVCCLDKLEIIDIAKKIGTYETSILPYEDCCTIFVPEHPVINPEKELAREYEEKFDYNTLIKEAIKTKETITLPRKEEEFDNIL